MHSIIVQQIGLLEYIHIHSDFVSCNLKELSFVNKIKIK